MKYQIISDGIPIGNFRYKPDAQFALTKYVKSGFIREINDN